MVPHPSSTPAVAGVLLVSGSSCSTAPPSTPPTSWHHPSTRPLRKVSLCANVYECKGVICQCTDFSLCVLFSGHRECLELLLSYGAHIDIELPVVGTPLYSACMAQAAACVGVLLHSGNLQTLQYLQKKLPIKFGYQNYTKNPFSIS